MKLPERRPRRQARDLSPTTPVRLNREESIARFEQETFDLVVVGGGITGSYVALDAALRGYRVALVEKDDFASGTSSKSSKMVHGGLRYIEQGNLPLVRHSLLERQRLRRNAVHLVQRLPFLFPILSVDGIFDRRLAKGFESLLWSYDLAGGWREGVLHRKLSPEEVLAQCPLFKEENLDGGLMYYDARVDDARLTLTVARTAAFHGAAIANHAKAASVLRTGGKVSGVLAEVDGREVAIRARSVVVAVGSWLRDWDPASAEVDKPSIRPAKGVHIAVPWEKIQNSCTVTIPVPGRTRRATITRWGNTSYLGTTDDDYEGDLDEPYCTEEDMHFLLDGAMTALNTELSPSDVVGSIAGTRPLVAPPGRKTVEVKRNHEIRTDPDGLVTVVGGKLTTARHMAEQTVDAVGSVLDEKRRCFTAKAHLLGAAGYDGQAAVASGGLPAHLAERFGTESRFVSGLIAEDSSLATPIVEGLPYTEAEVVYAVRHEMAGTVDDVLSRRTRSRLMARNASGVAAARVGQILGTELDLRQPEVATQVENYLGQIRKEESVLMGMSQK